MYGGDAVRRASEAAAAAGPACLVCGGSTRPLWHVRSNADGPLARGFDVRACSECGAGLTDPLPRPDELPSLHGAGAHESAGGRGLGLAERALLAQERARLKRIRRFAAPPGRLLDVGAGKGRFVACAAAEGWAVQGVEPAPGQVSAARARFGLELARGGVEDLAGVAAFDVVTAWHVIEHVRDPGDLLDGVTRLLRPGGLFVCEVPHFGSWQARLAGSHWLHL
jgi:SAM-dependent methyltransferase